MAVQTTVTTTYRSHAVEGLNGFVSKRTSVAFRRGGSECRIGANQVFGPLTGEASGFIGSGVTVVNQGVLCSRYRRARTGKQWYTRWTIRDHGHGWETTLHPSEMTVELTRESLVKRTLLTQLAQSWSW